MELNKVFKDIIIDIDRRKWEIDNFISVIKSIHNIWYYYEVWWKKRKNPNLDIKHKSNILLKSWIVIIYSHREWFLKFSSERYLEFLSKQNFKRDQLPRCFFDEYINSIKSNKSNLSDVLSNLLDNNPIPIDTKMTQKFWNLDYTNTTSFFKNLWLDFNLFLQLRQDEIESRTWLWAWQDFIYKLWKFKDTTHFLVDYIKNNGNCLEWDSILKKILTVKDNDIWLVALRHKIAHGVDTHISLERFISLSHITLLLLEVYLKCFQKDLSNRYGWI